MLTRYLCAAFLLWVPTHAMAHDAYLVRFLDVDGRNALCHKAIWKSDVLFYNRSSTDAVVRLLDISNGTMPNTVDTALPVPPGRVIAMGHLDPSKFYWAPAPPRPDNERLWVMHVDIPDGVSVESRNEVIDNEWCTDVGAPLRRAVGKVSMPVITRLAPAGTPQVTLGTDIVARGSRTNVMVYNAAEQTASATIEVRRACDDTVIGRQVVNVPPRTIRQFGGFTNDLDTVCPFPPRAEQYVRYTVVTVDQPSFTIVSTLTESQEPSVGDVTPLIELAVAVNSIF
jgi:hypothetical protein